MIIYAQYTIALASGAQTFEPSQTLAILSTIFSYVSLAVRLLLLVFSNRLYMAYVLRSIKRIRACLLYTSRLRYGFAKCNWSDTARRAWRSRSDGFPPFGGPV